VRSSDEHGEKFVRSSNEESSRFLCIWEIRREMAKARSEGEVERAEEKERVRKREREREREIWAVTEVEDASCSMSDGVVQRKGMESGQGDCS
jgi:septal ring factor EnvC (AmiA/AmiB activator)